MCLEVSTGTDMFRLQNKQVNLWTPFKFQLLHVHTLLDTEYLFQIQIRKCNRLAQGDVYFKMKLTTQAKFKKP